MLTNRPPVEIDDTRTTAVRQATHRRRPPASRQRADIRLRRRFDIEMSWAIDWLFVALDARNEHETQRAIRAALQVLERRTVA